MRKDTKCPLLSLPPGLTMTAGEGGTGPSVLQVPNIRHHPPQELVAPAWTVSVCLLLVTWQGAPPSNARKPVFYINYCFTPGQSPNVSK